jgi:mRNA-degrading endonuclease toxin of MazEF toxin-antitoxin module
MWSTKKNALWAFFFDVICKAQFHYLQQFRMIDTAARAARLIERAPDEVTEEVRARVAALVD